MREIAPGITVDQRVRFGRPVIRGTRVPVDLLVGKVAGGMSIDEVAEEYELKREDVLAAVGYAAPPVMRLRTSATSACGGGRTLTSLTTR